MDLDDKGKDLLIFGKGSTQGLGEQILSAELNLNHKTLKLKHIHYA